MSAPEQVNPKLALGGVQLVAVGIGTPERAKEFCELTGFPPSQLLADPENECYDALQLNKGAALTFLRPETPLALAQRTCIFSSSFVYPCTSPCATPSPSPSSPPSSASSSSTPPTSTSPLCVQIHLYVCSCMCLSVCMFVCTGVHGFPQNCSTCNYRTIHLSFHLTICPSITACMSTCYTCACCMYEFAYTIYTHA